ncbi:MAG TPA: Fe-S cluster assembly protein SufD [bacterium]
MANTRAPDAIADFAKRLREPAWVTDARRRSLERHAALPWPHPSDEFWRRTDLALLDPARAGFAPVSNGDLDRRIPIDEACMKSLIEPLGGERLIVRAGGDWVRPPSGKDLIFEEFTGAAAARPEELRAVIAPDGMTEAEEKLCSLNGAFHRDGLLLSVPAGTAVAQPVRLVHLVTASARQAVYPLTVISVGAGSALTLIDEYVGIDLSGSAEPHLVNSRIELRLAEGANVQYVRLQRWHRRAREFSFQRATLGTGATLSSANLYLGAKISKTHVVTRLSGAHSSARLYGFVFGQGGQHVDQHTLQDHQAPHTSSDLLVKAALQDDSRMVYTGLIRIANQAVQTSAYQSNHNLLLSSRARAETIPMLEILADDVQCKHGASAGPINEDELFYLRTRGIPRAAAERLIVMGFVEQVIQQVPFAPLQERLREEIEGGLHQASGHA